MEKFLPFSIHHDWRFEPTILPDDMKIGHAPIRAPKEITALKAIGQIGIIGSVQIGRLFGFKRHHIRRMLAEKKLVQHSLSKNKNSIPVFTMGPRAANLLQLPFDLNKWRTWSIDQILQKLVFFQFCCAMNDKQKNFHMHEAAFPFTGKVEIDGDIRQVLIVRKPIEKLDEAMRHNSTPVIVIAETIDQVQPYNELLKDAKLLLDEDLWGDYRFYRWGYDKWEK